LTLARTTSAIVVCLSAAACGPTALGRSSVTPVALSTPPALSADALPGHSTDLQTLLADDLAQQVASVGDLDAAAVRSELEATGFVAGSGRSFAVPGQRVRTVLARVLEFSSADGAARYLEWTRTNAVKLLGDGSVEPGVRLPGAGFVFLHDPGGCCAKDQAAAVGVWRRGRLVLSVQAIGAVEASDAARYATTLNRTA
jgi:hypothetical protein